MDHIVREIERDFVERKIGELDVLGIDDVVIAVAAFQRRAAVLVDLKLPELELFAGNTFLVLLADRDRVEKLIGPAFVGHEFRAVGEGDVAVDSVPVPVFGTCELPEIDGGEFRRVRHREPLSF
jgi:hypothetical protein